MGKLERIAQEHNEPLHTLLPRIVAEEGSLHRAATRLGVYPNSIQYWINKNGYKLVVDEAPRQVARLVKIEPDTAQPTTAEATYTERA
jgi:hypothetical protein